MGFGSVDVPCNIKFSWSLHLHYFKGTILFSDLLTIFASYLKSPILCLLLPSFMDLINETKIKILLWNGRMYNFIVK